jgi:hypothetical protein
MKFSIYRYRPEEDDKPACSTTTSHLAVSACCLTCSNGSRPRTRRSATAAGAERAYAARTQSRRAAARGAVHTDSRDADTDRRVDELNDIYKLYRAQSGRWTGAPRFESVSVRIGMCEERALRRTLVLHRRGDLVQPGLPYVAERQIGKHQP